MEKIKKLSEEDFFKIFSESPENVATIAWSSDRDWIVITKRDGSKIKFDASGPQIDGNFLLTLLPETFEFVGFQHTIENITFDCFGRCN